MAAILRGDIRWADLNPVIGSEQGGMRPVLVLSHNVFNSDFRAAPHEVQLRPLSC